MGVLSPSFCSFSTFYPLDVLQEPGQTRRYRRGSPSDPNSDLGKRKKQVLGARTRGSWPYLYRSKDATRESLAAHPGLPGNPLRPCCRCPYLEHAPPQHARWSAETPERGSRQLLCSHDQLIYQDIPRRYKRSVLVFHSCFFSKSSPE